MTAPLRAFTLLELLVTMGLVAVLLGLVIVAMSGVRQSANRTASLYGLRQMVVAYNTYSTDHRYRLMPGYIGEFLLLPGQIFEGLTAKLPSGEALNPLDTQAYVWRLAPYLDDAWKTMFVDYRSKTRLSKLEMEYGCGIYGPGTLSVPCSGLPGVPIGIGQAPSFGMNSIFVGGDSFHGGLDVTEHNPWTGSKEKLAATRFSEVKNPAKLIVFGTAALASGTDFSGDPDDEVYDSKRLGYVELRPPFTVFESGAWTNRQWAVGKNLEVIRTADGDYDGPTGAGAGLPVSRWGANRLPVANLDGSTGIEETSTLAVDMRRWSPFAFGMNVPAFTP